MSILNGKKIAVLGGGPGSERKISQASARSVFEALKARGLDVVEVDVKDENFELPEDTALAFNVIHGTFGEDGSLQKILEERGVPYTGAGVASSEIAFDKILSKKAFIQNSVPTPAFELAAAGAEEIPDLSLPCCIKPPREGSSVGVHIVKTKEEIPAALKDVAKYDQIALVESFVSGKELTVGVLGRQAFPVVHICPRDGFYDINNKYPWLASQGGTDYFCPADLSPETTKKVQAAALAAHRALGVEIYSRVDILLDEEENPWVLEVNTIPGMTESSLLPKGAAAVGIAFDDLCVQIGENSLKARTKPDK